MQVPPEALAEAGFELQPGGRIACQYCTTELPAAPAGLEAWVAHRRRAPGCPLVAARDGRAPWPESEARAAPEHLAQGMLLGSRPPLPLPRATAHAAGNHILFPSLLPHPSSVLPKQRTISPFPPPSPIFFCPD